MSKLRLLSMIVLVVAFLLSLWAVPAAMVVLSFTVVETLWIKITLWVTALLWLPGFRPWKMFSDPRWNDFVYDMRRAIKVLIN